MGFDSRSREITFGTLFKKSKNKKSTKDEKDLISFEKKNYNLWQTVMNRSVKIFNFYDLGGSEKAQKTSVNPF